MEAKRPPYLMDLMTGVSLGICISLAYTSVLDLRLSQAEKIKEEALDRDGSRSSAINGEEYDVIIRQLAKVSE